ncbi:MAG TPA: OmcA/MtrC family decaheme c-type cytochrome [Thermoanaerobaculia bacterium]
MQSILRGLLVLASIGSVSFPTTPPASVANNAVAAQSSGRRHAANPGAPATPAKPVFTADQIEFYVNDDGIAYIRPGLNVKVNSIVIGSDRKVTADVTLTDDMGQPIDRNGKLTPGAVSISLGLGWYNPDTRQYTSYMTRVQTSPANSPHPNVSATQATTDSNGTWTDLEAGHSKYAFKTVLPAGFDQSKTHTLFIFATRNLTDIIGKNYFANVEFDFRPDGAKVTETWDKINTAASCNNCHDPLAMHGGSRRDAKLCALCHTPQSTDPDTGNTVDLKVMVHKIHSGENLPSVKAGTPYQVIGFGQAVSDWSTVALPMDIRNCDRCHVGTNAAAKPAQNDVWLTRPGAAACGSCHDDVNFATGANHAGGAQKDDSACAQCHVPDSGKEFDASIKGAHVIPTKSKQLKGLTAAIVKVDNFSAGNKPTVYIAVKNADGSAVDGTKLNQFAPMYGGPTGSYSTFLREAGAKTATFDASTGLTSYTWTKPLPADASGTWVVTADVYRNVTIKRTDGKDDVAVRECAMNPIKYVAISGAATPRRTVVTLAQCSTCHESLGLHGGQRQTTEECVICHNPNTGDGQTPAESVSFQRLIHRIHTGEELTQPYKVGNTSFNEVRFPGDRKNCGKCHAGTSYTLPVANSAQPVTTLRDFFSPQGPGTAACLGCHDNKDAAAHAYLNTTTFPGATQSQEACATCHGTGKDWAAEKVHAR